jgi:hypothetical protein
MTAVEATGGDPLVVATVLVGLVVALVLGLVIAYELFAGYRRVRNPEMLQLAVGLVLLTTLPILLRLVLTTFSSVPPATRSLVVSGCELTGLLVILTVIYDVR